MRHERLQRCRAQRADAHPKPVRGSSGLRAFLFVLGGGGLVLVLEGILSGRELNPDQAMAAGA
jgi:hypothetical protein